MEIPNMVQPTFGWSRSKGRQEQLQQPMLSNDKKSGTLVSHFNTDCFMEYNAVEPAF